MSEIEKLSDEIKDIMKSAGIKLSDFHNVKTLTDCYIEYAENIDKKKINIGFPLLDEQIRGLRVQELLTVVAGTGIGKSALALNFLMNFVKKTNELTVLFSLEMSSIGIGERIFQIEMDKFGFEIENGFIKQDKKFIENCRGLKSSLSNFIIITNRIEIHSIPAYIKAIETIKNDKVRLICVDYLGLMDNNYFQKDEYLRITDNMKKLYSYAKTLDLAIINLSQTSRADVKDRNGNSGGLSLYSGKGSGEVENSSDFFITLEKVELEISGKTGTDLNGKINAVLFYNEHKSKELGELDLMKLVIHKNRRGKKGVIYVTFNRKNLRIKEFNEMDFKTVNTTNEQKPDISF
jgi:replicative DNA helicase